MTGGNFDSWQLNPSGILGLLVLLILNLSAKLFSLRTEKHSPPKPHRSGGFFNFMKMNLRDHAPFLVIVSLAIVAWAIVFAIGCIENAQLAKFGLFGDFFGSINSLFSALAMSGAIYALILQTRQTSDDKKHDRDMLRRSKLEAVVTANSELKHLVSTTIFEVTQMLTDERGIDQPRRHEIRMLCQRIASSELQIHTLSAIYFHHKHVALMILGPGVLHKLVIDPINELATAESDPVRFQALDKMHTSSVDFAHHLSDCIVKTIEKMEEIIVTEK